MEIKRTDINPDLDLKFSQGRPAYTVVYDICDAYTLFPSWWKAYTETEPNRITSILVSQFLLELQAADKRIRAGGSELSLTNSRISSVVFHRVAGSIRHVSLTPGEDEVVNGESLFEDLAEEFVQEGSDEEHNKVVPDAQECSSPAQIVEGVMDEASIPLASETVQEV